jgi:hypothetical protein
MKHYFENVPGIGNVAISRHAQTRAVEDSISEATFADALVNGSTIPDGHGVVWREKNGVRIVIVKRPEPFRGAALATTAFRVKCQEKAKP